MSTLSISDVERIVSNASNEQFKSFLRGNRVKLDSICLGGSVFASTLGVANPKVMAFITGAAVANFGNSIVKAFNDSIKFGREYRMELLEQTAEYQECKRNYNSYVAKIGDFIGSLGVTDSLDVGMLYMKMLYGGFISEPGSFMYHKFKTDYDMCTPLMGARVTSGGAVCRHIASNLRDIYKYMGIPAVYLSVSGTDDSVKSALIDRFLPHRPNHAVVMVGDNYGRYVIDPTWGTVAEFGQSDNFAHIVFNKGHYPMYHVDIDGTVSMSKTYDYNDYIRLRIIKPMHFARGEIRQASNYAEDFIHANYYRFNNLSYRLRNEMHNTAVLERMLSGYSDVPQISTSKRLVRK